MIFFVRLFRLKIEFCCVCGFELGSDVVRGAVDGGGGRGAYAGLSFKIFPDLLDPSGDKSIPSSLSRLALNGSGSNTDLSRTESYFSLLSVILSNLRLRLAAPLGGFPTSLSGFSFFMEFFKLPS